MPAATKPSDFTDKRRGFSDADSAKVGSAALSPGERVSRDGAFFSRRGTGEGFLPLASHVVQLKLRTSYSAPALPVRFAQAAQPERGSKLGMYWLRGRSPKAKSGQPSLMQYRVCGDNCFTHCRRSTFLVISAKLKVVSRC